MPSGLVDDEYGVLAGSHFGGDFGEVQVHRLGVAGGQDERGSLAIAGADSPEDVGGSGALIVRRRGPRSPSCPAPGDLVLLPDPGLVPEPDLYPVAIDPLVARDRVQALGERFLKASTAPALSTSRGLSIRGSSALPMSFQSFGSFRGTSLGNRQGLAAAPTTSPKAARRPEARCVSTPFSTVISAFGTFQVLDAAAITVISVLRHLPGCSMPPQINISRAAAPAWR